MASDVRTFGRALEEDAVGIAISSHFLQSVPHDSALTGFQLLKRTQFARSQILRKFFQGSDILSDKLSDRTGCPSRWVIEVDPRVGAFEDELRNQQTGDHPMCHTWAGVPRDDKHSLVFRIASYECAVIDRLEDLA